METALASHQIGANPWLPGRCDAGTYQQPAADLVVIGRQFQDVAGREASLAAGYAVSQSPGAVEIRFGKIEFVGVKDRRQCVQSSILCAQDAPFTTYLCLLLTRRLIRTHVTLRSHEPADCCDTDHILFRRGFPASRQT
jgi:hypothetical protein